MILPQKHTSTQTTPGTQNEDLGEFSLEEFLSGWEAIQLDTSLKTQDIIISPQETTLGEHLDQPSHDQGINMVGAEKGHTPLEGNEPINKNIIHDTPDELIHRDTLGKIQNILQYNSAYFPFQDSPRLQQWYHMMLTSLSHINKDDSIKTADNGIQGYQYFFLILQKHKQMVSRVKNHRNRAFFLERYFPIDPLDEIIEKERALDQNDYSISSLEKWFQYYMGLQYHLLQLDQFTHELFDLHLSQLWMDKDSDFQEQFMYDCLHDGTTHKDYKELISLVIADAMRSARNEYDRILKQMNDGMLLHHRFGDPKEKQEFRDQIQSYRNKLKHPQKPPKDMNDHTFIVGLFQEICVWREREKEYKRFIDERFVGYEVHHPGKRVAHTQENTEKIIENPKDLEVITQIGDYVRRVNLRCDTIEQAKKIAAVGEFEGMIDSLNGKLHILEERGAELRIESQKIHHLTDDIQSLLDKIEKIREELEIFEQNRKTQSAIRDQQEIYIDVNDTSLENRELTVQQYEYIDFIEGLRDIVISSTVGNADKSKGSRSDGQTSYALKSFFVFVISKIKEGKILVHDDTFSWSQIYHLRIKDHQVNQQNRQDKIVDAILQVLGDANSPIAHIPGILEPTSFYDAFGSFYSIVKLCAEQKQKALRDSNSSLELYLPKLRKYLTDKGCYI